MQDWFWFYFGFWNHVQLTSKLGTNWLWFDTVHRFGFRWFKVGFSQKKDLL